jgi:hypothetical protein
MKNFYRTIGGICISFCFPAIVSAVNIIVPVTDPDPLIIEPQASTITADENIFRNLIQFINEYLWLILIIVAFGVLVYTGAIMMTSPDEDGRKKIGKMFISLIGGILIAIFAYVFVGLLANLL